MTSLFNSLVFMHLWQSTIFAATCALLTLAMRRNPARVRFALWLAASLKFLIPFSILTEIGSRLDFLRPVEMPAAVKSAPRLVMNLGMNTEAIALRARPALPQAASPFDWTLMLICLWVCGFAFVVAKWTREWLRLRRMAHAAEAIKLDVPISVRSVNALIEPGIFGVWRPVLLIPKCMLERLSPEEIAGVLAHELAHVRRRDNLWAFLHMLIEATFWFYPLVFWIGKKLVDERERACDEAVLGSGNAPESYAEGILKVCEFCIAPAPACAAGVTGADLKQRVRVIMANRIAEGLGIGKRLLLAAAGIAAIAFPVAIGILDAPLMRGQNGSKLAFEVASVKPNDSTDMRSGHEPLVLPGGRLSVKNAPLYYVIAWAYDVPFQGAGARLKGIETLSTLGAADARFDIEATAEKSAIANDMTLIERTNKMRAMMRTLLAERFHLVIRSETKDTPVYAAVIGKNGLKLEKSKLEEKDCDQTENQDRAACHQFNGGMGRGLHAQAASIYDLVNYVANWSDRPIVDRTGVKGLFKIETPGWAPVDTPRGDGSQKGEDGVPWSERPTLFTIFEGMGLKLEATHAPIETYTIVSVEKPAAN